MKTKLPKVTKISKKLPIWWEVTASDYHCFEDYEGGYNALGLNVHYDECGCDGDYHAIFYLKKTKEVKAAINKLSIELLDFSNEVW